MTETIRILIADDHPVVRKGLKMLITNEPDMEVTGEAVDGVDTVLKASKLQPDVILLDLKMPKLDGIGAIQQIRLNNPEARILVITSYAEDEKVFAAIRAGVRGYLLKNSTPQQLKRAIREVFHGKPSLDDTIALKLMRGVNEHPDNRPPTVTDLLTARETTILIYVAKGLTNKGIAEELHISDRTVANHVKHILKKLDLDNRTQAALFASEHGLTTVDLK